MTATLYRFFDEDGALLYIGISESPLVRLDAHASTQPWWGHVRSATFEHFGTRQEVLDAEVAAIRDERPAFNVEHNGDPRLSERLQAWDQRMQRRALAAARVSLGEEDFRLPPYDVPCPLPMCGALDFEPCRTRRGIVKSEVHSARDMESWKARHCKTCGSPPRDLPKR